MSVRVIRPEDAPELQKLADEMGPLRDRPTRPLPFVRPEGETLFDGMLEFHTEIRNSLDLLDELARAPDYGDHERAVAYTLWEFFTGPLQWHDLDEDQSIFGRLRDAKLAVMFDAIVKQTMEDHQEMGKKLAVLLPHLEELIRGDECHAADFILAALELRQMIEPHLALEERELYGFARHYFNNETLAEIEAEIEQRMRERGEARARKQSPS